MNASSHMLHSLSYIQKQSPRGVFQERCSANNLDSLQEKIHAKVWLQLYSFVNTLHICSRLPFLENTSGELLLYIVLNTEVTNVEVLSKQLKNCLKYISILQTLFLTLYVTFAWWPKVSFQKPQWLLIKHERGGIYMSLVPEL